MSQTVLITGTSSGIGKELALQFAKGGDDVVLVARSEGKFHELAEQIRENHGVVATVMRSDLATTGGVDQLCDQLREPRRV